MAKQLGRFLNAHPKIISNLKEAADMRDKVEAVLAMVRPTLQADGGDVELVSVDGSVVKVKLTGACGMCPMAQLTLKHHVGARLKKEIPEITSVETV